MADPTSFYFILDPEKGPDPIRLPERRVPDYRWFNANRAKSRGVHPITGITTVVIHATAGWATQHALDAWHNGPASAHWIIPDEDEPQHGEFVWAVVSESLAANHVKNSIVRPELGSGNRINNRSLGVEIVNTQNVQNYTDPYSDWQIEMAALIVRYCWAKYPNLRHVISHARIDPVNRGDPGKNFPWDKFKALVHSANNDPKPDKLATELLPVTAFPSLDGGAGGCCP